MKEQRTWQKHWQSTTHWQHWIWGWDLFNLNNQSWNWRFYWNSTITGQSNWSWRSKEHGRSIVNQQHIDNIGFGGEICLFLELANSKLTILLKFNIRRLIKLELKEQSTWQKHCQPTTHWQHCIWGWDLFVFGTSNLEIDDFIEIQHSQGNVEFQ